MPRSSTRAVLLFVAGLLAGCSSEPVLSGDTVEEWIDGAMAEVFAARISLNHLYTDGYNELQGVHGNLRCPEWPAEIGQLRNTLASEIRDCEENRLIANDIMTVFRLYVYTDEEVAGNHQRMRAFFGGFIAVARDMAATQPDNEARLMEELEELTQRIEGYVESNPNVDRLKMLQNIVLLAVDEEDYIDFDPTEFDDYTIFRSQALSVSTWSQTLTSAESAQTFVNHMAGLVEQEHDKIREFIARRDELLRQQN